MGNAENAVEQLLRKRVEAAGGVCLKFQSSRSGVPDRVVVLNGHTVFVELKAPKGRLSRIQEVRIAELQRAGASVIVIASKPEVDSFMQMLLTNQS